MDVTVFELTLIEVTVLEPVDVAVFEILTVAVEVEVAVFGITLVEVVEIVRVAVLDNVDE